MNHPIQLRYPLCSRRHVWLLCCLLFAIPAAQIAAQTSTAPQTEAQPSQTPPALPAQDQVSAHITAGAGPEQTLSAAGLHPVQPQPGKRKLREAESAYFAGAKKLEQDDLDAAEHEFRQALDLDPENPNYAIAISVTRQHRLTELVQQASKARQAGDQGKAETLLAEARSIDPTNPIVLEHVEPVNAEPAHTEPVMAASLRAPQPASAAGGGTLATDQPAGAMQTTAAAQQLWSIQTPALSGAIHIKSSDQVKSFDLQGDSSELLRSVALAFGIRVIVDESVERKHVHFVLANVNYGQAMTVLMSMTQVFAVPVDETTVMVARDNAANRQQWERQLEETIQVPGSTPEHLNELANVIRTIFSVRQATVQAGQGTIVVRAPEDVLLPMNQALQELMEPSGEVMVEVKVYEINTMRSTNVGTAIPSQFSVFNVDQTATSIVNANQSLVQQAIAQGLISATASNLQIALALLGSGLVQSSLASNLIGVFGGGAFQTGISASTNMTFNLARNSSDTRALDDVQLRVGDRQPAIFREGTKYPVITSTYTTGLSTAASTLSSATINGVSVASLLAQYAGGTSTTIPQVTYEDLGITLNATPVIQKTGRINLLLDLKIEALTGGSANGIPVLGSRRFTSDLTLSDGESAMMVSYVSKTESAALTGIPGLSELPGFQLPTQRDAEKDSSELVVTVTPRIVRRRAEELAGPRIVMVKSTAAN